MPLRHPQIDMDAHDLIIRLPLENIPNMPADPHARQIMLAHIREKIGHYMASQITGGLAKAFAGRQAAPPAGALGRVR